MVVNPRRKYKRRGTGSVPANKDPSSSDDEAGSSMSESEEHELGALGSGDDGDATDAVWDVDEDDEDDDDEETGLNRSERRKYLQKKRQRAGLGSRIAGTAGLATATTQVDEIKEADKSVLRRILINAGLIGLWYFFSLSISIVSSRFPPHRPLLFSRCCGSGQIY